jgi:PHD/YefM family antitoxin component YafN of YafNO toxin-antitoxin module
MIPLRNIRPLSDFLRNAKSFMAALKKSSKPVILTVNGEAEAVILSAAAYQTLIEELETERILNIVHQSTLEQLRAGDVSPEALIKSMKPQPDMRPIPAEQAFAELERRIHGRRRKKAS